MQTLETKKTVFSLGKLIYTLTPEDEEWKISPFGIMVRRKNNIFLNGEGLIATIRKDPKQPLYPHWCPHAKGVLLHEDNKIFLVNKIEKVFNLIYCGVKDSWHPAANNGLIITTMIQHPGATMIWHFFEDGTSKKLVNVGSYCSVFPHSDGIVFEHQGKFYLNNFTSVIYTIKNGEDVQHAYVHKNGIVIREGYKSFWIKKDSQEDKLLYADDGTGNFNYKVTSDGIYVEQKGNPEIRFFTGE